MSDPILVTSENVNPLHYSQFSHENVAPSSGTFPLASYKEVAPSPQWCGAVERALASHQCGYGSKKKFDSSYLLS